MFKPKLVMTASLLDAGGTFTLLWVVETLSVVSIKQNKVVNVLLRHVQFE